MTPSDAKMLIFSFQEEADQCMAEATERYRGKPLEEQQLVLLNAQLRLQRGNVDGALRVLQAVKAGLLKQM